MRNLAALKEFIRQNLIIDPSAVNPEKIERFWLEILASGRMDFFRETLTYTTYKSTGIGTVYYNFNVDIYDYAAVPISCFIHETCHSFNEYHAGPSAIGVGWNEGSAIALAKYYCREPWDLAETVFGTVLYYRDIGIRGYPEDMAIGDPNNYDEKGKEFVSWLMRLDKSGINWFDPREVEYVFAKYFAGLNRNVQWEEWLSEEQSALADWHKEKHGF